jgi:hypothetical protein
LRRYQAWWFLRLVVCSLPRMEQRTVRRLEERHHGHARHPLTPRYHYTDRSKEGLRGARGDGEMAMIVAAQTPMWPNLAHTPTWPRFDGNKAMHDEEHETTAQITLRLLVGSRCISRDTPAVAESPG